MQEHLETIVAELEQQRSLALAVVIERRGSLPMATTARMLVSADGSTGGTVGGGCLEAEIYARARRLLAASTGTSAAIDTFSLTEVEEGLQGHVCGGTVSILTELLVPDAATTGLFADLRNRLARGENVALATLLPGQGYPRGGHRLLLTPKTNEPVAGTAIESRAGSGIDPDGAASRLAAAGRQALADARPRVVGLDGVGGLVDSEPGSTRGTGSGLVAADNAIAGARYFVEPLLTEPRAVIFGAGHCGRAIARIAGFAGFRTVVLDDRPAFADPELVPEADEVAVVDFADLCELAGPSGPSGSPGPSGSYDDADCPRPSSLPSGGVLGGGQRDYLVIVTRGHEHDLTVLRQVLAAAGTGGAPAYLGMIGSRRKRLMFLKTLKAEGYCDEDLAALRSPMGLSIGADTPEEIAVAVVGEMIAARRGV